MLAAMDDDLRPEYELDLDFCRMAIGPIFFKEILFFDFLEEST